MMSAANYEMETHKQAHDDFLAKIKGLAVPVGEDTVAYAKDWWVYSYSTKL